VNVTGMTEADARAFEAGKALMDRPDFIRDLDALSVEVMELVEAFGLEHGADAARVVNSGEQGASLFMSLVVGWILGFPGAHATDQAREGVVSKHVILAAYAAGMSANLCASSARKEIS
jgi:hypothetical protein